MASYRYHLGAYGRLVRYVWAIKTEVAVKVAVSLGVNATYIAQAVLMAQAVQTVFRGGGTGVVGQGRLRFKTSASSKIGVFLA